MKAQMYNYQTWLDEGDHEAIVPKLKEALVVAKFSVLGFNEFKFEPQGYTALWLLGESHLALHTFPEHNQSYVELTSCVKEQHDDFIRHFNG